MTLDEFAKILVKLDASNYGYKVESNSTDDEYYDAQREEAGLMDWTSHYGMVVGDDGERKSGLDVREQQAWIIRKHLAKIVIDGIRFDKDHLDKLGFADNDHMRELGGLVATYYKRNQFMHNFAINNIFYDYFRDWTKNNFDSDQVLTDTLTYDMSDKTYAQRKAPFDNDAIKYRRSEFIKFWADHFGGRKEEDYRATYDWEPSDDDLKYWIERDWFNYFEKDPKRFERVVVMLCETLENNKEIKERFKKCVQ